VKLTEKTADAYKRSQNTREQIPDGRKDIPGGSQYCRKSLSPSQDEKLDQAMMIIKKEGLIFLE
jgi:hypothetical protein